MASSVTKRRGGRRPTRTTSRCASPGSAAPPIPSGTTSSTSREISRCRVPLALGSKTSPRRRPLRQWASRSPPLRERHPSSSGRRPCRPFRRRSAAPRFLRRSRPLRRAKATARKASRMTSRSNASDPAQAAMQVALRLLSLRGRSRRELKLALARKGFAEPQQEAVLARLGELGYVDDVRFARDRASALLRGGKLGPRAVLQRLFAHGLSEEQARQALSHAEREVGMDPLEAARSVLKRR